METQNIKNSQTVLKQKKKTRGKKTKSKTARGISTADFLLHYTVMAIKSAGQCPPNKHWSLEENWTPTYKPTVLKLLDICKIGQQFIQ